MVQTKRGRGRPRKNNGEVTMVEENTVASEANVEAVPEEVVEAVPEVVEEELPMGNDPSILYAGREEHSLEIVHAGQRWLFKYKDLSWGEKNQCIDEAQQWDTDAGFKFSVTKYYAAALTKMLTSAPIKPITETTLNQLDRHIGEQLIAIVPQPVEPAVEDVKKA